MSMLFTFLLYAGIGLASIVPFARHLYRNKSSYDSPGYIAFMAWLSSLVWPVTGIIFGTEAILQRDKRKKQDAKDYARTLEGARALIAKEEWKLEQQAKTERRERNRRLRQQLADFDKQMQAIEGPPMDEETTPAWRDYKERLRRRTH